MVDPLTVAAAVTGAVMGQTALCFRFNSVFDFFRRLLDCLRNPRPPPSNPITTQMFGGISTSTIKENDKEH